MLLKWTELKSKRFNFPIDFGKIGVLFNKCNINVHKGYNLMKLVMKQFSFACKYKTVLKLYMST